MFKAFIYGVTLRYARNTNNEDDFTEKVSFLTKITSQRLYSNNRARTRPLLYAQTEIHVDNATHNVSLANRAKLIHSLPNGKQNMEAPLVFSTSVRQPQRCETSNKQALASDTTKPTTLGNISKTTLCCIQKSPKHSGENNPSKSHKCRSK